MRPNRDRPSSGPEIFASDPPNLPTAVRAAETITISVMIQSFQIFREQACCTLLRHATPFRHQGLMPGRFSAGSTQAETCGGHRPDGPLYNVGGALSQQSRVESVPASHLGRLTNRHRWYLVGNDQRRFRRRDDLFRGDPGRYFA